MKRDLTLATIVAVLGIVAAYFLTNMLLPEMENFSFRNISGSTNFTLTAPDEEIFNYRAVNPTVEVYVGQCKEYNEDGLCIDEVISNDENVEGPEENTEEENGASN